MIPNAVIPNALALPTFSIAIAGLGWLCVGLAIYTTEVQRCPALN